MLRLTTWPTSNPETMAPQKLPSPPIVTTTNAAVPTFTPIAGWTPASGAESTPAIAANALPRPKTSVSTGLRLMPRSRTIIGSRLPARTIVPIGVFWRNGVRAEREERAVREVDDAEHPEDDRQPERHQHVQRTQHEPVEDELGEDRDGHRPERSTLRAPAGTGSRPSGSRSSPATHPAAAPPR